MGFGILSFLSPLPLLGLIALPVIWWLLRATPPSPDKQQFPPTRILRDLLQSETTSAHSPWWLTLLRLLAAACVIFALAQPVLNNDENSLRGDVAKNETDKSAPGNNKNSPVLVMVDNGWTAATGFELYKIMLRRILRAAQEQDRLVYLIETAPLQVISDVRPMDALDALALVDRIAPTPFSPHREAAFERLDKVITTIEANGNAGLQGVVLYWLADGLAFNDDEILKAKFADLKKRGVDVLGVMPEDTKLPLALASRLGKGGVLHGVVKGVAVPAERSGVLLALSGKEEILGRTPFILEAGETQTEVRVELPLELRNQVAKLKLLDERSAGGVQLLDQRSNWRRIGLISNESGAMAQPLLSPLYYIRRALEPYAELVTNSGPDAAVAIEEFTKRNVSVVVMADIGRLVGAPLLRLTEWVEKGGVLVRFAGPHMEESQDSLLPTPLRQGGRRLGGALSWSKPQRLAPFDDTSLFGGLEIPDEVVVTRQLLADPSRIRDKVQIWARLQDGTPLVTASRELDGWLVLVHVTANSDWSNLPLSGLFVEMLQRLSQLSGSALASIESGADNSDEVPVGETIASSEKETLLAPFRTLNGYGELGKAPVFAEPLAFKQLNTMKPGPTHPPGFYGPAGQTVALNVINEETVLKKSDFSSLGIKRLAYKKAELQALRGPLFVTALILLLIDSLVVLSMRGLFSARRLQVGCFVILLGCAGFAGSFTPVGAGELGDGPMVAQAQESLSQEILTPENIAPTPQQQKLNERNLKAVLKTHLAYVLTGDAKIDQTSKNGLRGLSYVLNNRTAVEPAEPMSVELESDELSFFPVLYWPVGPYTKPISDEVAQRINAYMKFGGMIIFDTKDQDSRIGGLVGSGQSSLQELLSKLDIPRIEPVPKGHVLTKSFYLLSSFPGRFQGGDMWVEAATRRNEAGGNGSAVQSTSDIDGVSTLLITSNDLASAWAVDENFQSLYPVIPGGSLQREMAFRVGVNIVMYALAGNYKADQVHIPALLERLGQ